MVYVPLAVPRMSRRVNLTFCLIAGVVLVSALSLSLGAAGLNMVDLLSAVWGEGLSRREQVIFFNIRLPRLVMGMMVGAALAVSGLLLQGLFRNPLADPGIIGVGAGASLGAVSAIVLGGLIPPALSAFAGGYLVTIGACLGGWVFTAVLYHFASSGGRTHIATLLLAGIALGALAGAVMGILIYLADDRQLRDLTFWSMGSLAGATWTKILAAFPLIGAVLILSPWLGRNLNFLALGEAQATYMGVNMQRLKRSTVCCSAVATGAAVAVSGGIGFIGIAVPHLLRLIEGPDHRRLIPHAALLGAIITLSADLLARLIVAPAELPIGIITALLGAPVFLWILLQQGPVQKM